MTEVDFQKVRSDFPLLSKKVRGRNLVYLDSAATALKPWPVIERISLFNTYETANVHRGAHYLADQATVAFEDTREAVRDFIQAESKQEIVFTKGATDSLNLIAYSWGLTNLRSGDEILLTQMEHHANIVPWQLIAQKTGAVIQVVQLTERGELDHQDLEKKLTPRTKLFSFTACSNTLGTINPVKELTRRAHAVGAIVVVDAAQYVANQPLSVVDWNVDFLVFSGHKLFGPYGVGILYGRLSELEKMPPFEGGGSMISEVSFTGTTFLAPPFRFEAGTPNIEAVIALKPALEYVKKLGWVGIAKHEHALVQAAREGLEKIPGLRIVGSPSSFAPLLSFAIEGTHHADVGQILDQENVAVRVGHHCTQPLLKSLGLTGTVRASFSIYNNASDVEQLLKAVAKAKEMLT